MDPREIIAGIRKLAVSFPIVVDSDPYLDSAKDPLHPILFAGNLEAPLAFFARDLGRDEVTLGEPLVGSAGKRVRRAVYQFLFGCEGSSRDKYFPKALEHILLTNTVPYKPVGNIAYSSSVREALRPAVSEFLCCCWTGDYVITLGTEAFTWFEPYAPPGTLAAFWKRPDRYESEIRVEIVSKCDGDVLRRPLRIAPLPHPSPLNRTFARLFPELLDARLAQSPLNDIRHSVENP